MNVVRRSPLAVTVVCLAVMTAGCSGDSIRFMGERVKDPGLFLGIVEQTWRADLSKERVNVHKEARCYFSRGEEAKEIDSLAFCGPARHYVEGSEAAEGLEQTGTDAPGAVGGGVWDTYTFEGKVIEGGYQLATPSPELMGAVLPAGVTLFRLDGKTPPADGDKLAAPPPPAASPGFVGAVSSGVDDSGGTDETSSVTLVTGPKIRNPKTLNLTIEGAYSDFRLETVGTTDTIKTSEGLRTPAAGEEFVVATFSSQPGYWQDYLASGYSGPSNGFPEDDAVKDSVILTLTLPSGRTILPPASSNTIVASVPKGDATATITVASAGRDQSVELRSGKSIDAAPSLSETAIGRQYATQRKVLDDLGHDLAHSAAFGNAWLTAFHPLRGWAKPGRAWLLIEIKTSDYVWNNGWHDVVPDLSAGAKVQTGGVSSANVAKVDAGLFTGWSDAPNWPLFDVPANARSFKVTYEPTFTYTERPDGASQTSKLKAMTFDVTFPK